MNLPSYFQVRCMPSGRTVLFECGPFAAPLRPSIRFARDAQVFGRLVAIKDLGKPWQLVGVVQGHGGRPELRAVPIVAEDQEALSAAPLLEGSVADDHVPAGV